MTNLINKISLQLLTCNFHFLFLRNPTSFWFLFNCIWSTFDLSFSFFCFQGDFKFCALFPLFWSFTVMWFGVWLVFTVMLGTWQNFLVLFSLLFLLYFSLSHLTVSSYEILTHLDSLSNFFLFYIFHLLVLSCSLWFCGFYYSIFWEIYYISLLGLS